jgi:hypothetical protein
MTVQEKHDLFLILYDKVTNLASPGYTDDEIDSFLNKAQDQLVKQRYNFKANPYGDGFEETEKRRKDLSELIRGPKDVNGVLSTLSSSNQNSTLANGEFFDLPEDFLYAISEEVKISSEDSCLDGNIVSVRPITHDYYTLNRKNPFKKPSPDLVWRMDFSREVAETSSAKRHELITDGSFTVDEYYLRYIKRPREIDLSTGIASELDESVHYELVDKAVRIATGITDPQDYQIKTVEEKQSE